MKETTTTTTTTIKERILHTVLFQVVALSIMSIGIAIFTDKDPLTMSKLSLVISVVAMIWNYVYNIIFDKIAGEDRINRNIKKRIFHAIFFEIGLFSFTIPFLMWGLNLDFWSVFWLDIGISLYFLVFSIVYNYCYDKIKDSIIKNKTLLITD